MRRFARSAVLGILLSACSRSAGPTPPEELHIVAVEPDTQQRPGVVLLQWEDQPRRLGATYAMVDDTGYRGLLRTRAVSSVDCDHCPGPLVEADLLSGRGPSGYGAVAVGPVAGPLPRAKLWRSTGSHVRRGEWDPVLRLDLDGDGKFDVEQSERCGHSVPSGCSERVCNMLCTGTARVGHAPDTRFIHCRSFVPDVEDCGAGPD